MLFHHEPPEHLQFSPFKEEMNKIFVLKIMVKIWCSAGQIHILIKPFSDSICFSFVVTQSFRYLLY